MKLFLSLILSLGCLSTGNAASAKNNCGWDNAIERGLSEINQMAKDDGAESYGSGPSFAGDNFATVITPFVYMAQDQRSVIGYVAVDINTCKAYNYAGDYTKKPVQ